jgi:hypothetical protein
MAAEPGPFAAFYASAWQQPIALWIAAAAGAAVLVAQRDLHASVRRYGLGLAALSALDAWLTADHVVGIGALPVSLASVAPMFFVLAGDFRVLLLWDGTTRDGMIAITPRGLARAIGLTLIVPIFAQLVAPAIAPGNPRVLFLVYELAFFALVLALLRWHPNARALPWVRSVSWLVLLYYGLWAAADALLLATGSDFGFAVRVIPNLLYYGAVPAVMARKALRHPESAVA